MKKYKRKYDEDITDVPKYAWEELSRYNKDAGKLLKKDILEYFDEFKPSHSITVYRGLGFSQGQANDIIKKFKIKDIKIGSKLIYTSGKIQSWSIDEKVAKQFVGQFVLGRMRDLDSLGLLIKIDKLDPKDIAIPVAYLDKSYVKKYLEFDHSLERCWNVAFH